MTDEDERFEDFNLSQRTGRRNAIIEIPEGLAGPEASAAHLSSNKPEDTQQDTADAADAENAAPAEKETRGEGT